MQMIFYYLPHREGARDKVSGSFTKKKKIKTKKIIKNLMKINELFNAKIMKKKRFFLNKIYCHIKL